MDSLTPCRFCLHIITNKDFKLIDDVAKDMLTSLSLKLNFEIPSNQIMCGGCSEKLFVAFQFKSTCLYTHSTFFPYVNNDEMVQLDLREIYLKENGSAGFSDVSNDQKICALCLQLAKDRFTYICEVEEDLIEKFIPEMNFDIIESPIACEICLESLTVHTAFINKCLEHETKNCEDLAKFETDDIKIKTEMVQAEEDNEVTFEEIESQPVKSEFSDIKLEVWDESIIENYDLHEIKTEDDISESTLYQINSTYVNKSVLEGDELSQADSKTQEVYTCDRCSLKSTYKHHLTRDENPSEWQLYKCESCRDTSLQSQTDIMHTEGNKSLYELDHRKETSAESTFKNNQSEECSFKITSGSPSTGHERRQKRASEAQVNKNDANSKRRCFIRGLKVRKYQCDKFTYNTNRKDYFMQHKLIHKDASEVQMYECDKCLYRSIHKVTLMRHQLRHKYPAEVKMFKCDKCTFETKHKNNLVTHCLIHKDPSEVRMFKCDDCDYKSFRKGDVKQHQLIHKDPSELKMYKCEKCKFITKHKWSLIQHSLGHRDPTEVRVFQCDECDYKSNRKGNLKEHQLRHKDPSEVRVFQCDECDFKSKQKCHLKRHQLRHKDPSKLRVFECDECEYKSIHKESLRTHQMSHKNPSEVKMFKCDKCTYETKHKINLVIHCLKHKDPSEVRMFKCDECDYKSIRKGDVKQHQLTHKDPSEVKMYKCEKCRFITKHKWSLKQHSLSHKDPTEVRVFQCDECDYKSNRKGNLKEHQLRHKDASEVRVFQCGECDYKSKQKCHLKRHQLRRHKDPAEMQMENRC